MLFRSHQDADFVGELAARLVEADARVWVDTWEINVGDSLIDRIQEAIQDAGALLVVLSRASVESEWCRRELNAGLMRELEEKRVVILPVLREDCTIPVFLREKKYADFRRDFDEGFHDLLAAIAKVTNPEQGRIRTENSITDWAETWGTRDGDFFIEYDLIESTPESAFNILTQISVRFNEMASRQYRQYETRNLGWVARMIVAQQLAVLSEERMRVLLSDARPQHLDLRLQDGMSGLAYDVSVRCRRLGEDNGRDQLVTVSNYFRQIAEYVRSITRRLTDQEEESVAEILRER